MPITYTFLTNNEWKAAEYKAQLGQYGRQVKIRPYTKDEATRLSQIKAWLQSGEELDKYVLDEHSDLYVADDWDRGVETVSGKDENLQRVYNVSNLNVYSLGDDGALQVQSYQEIVPGHIDLSLKQDDDGWWDDVFVKERTSRSFVEEKDLHSKTSARQLVIAQFILDHVNYKKARDLTYNPHNPSQPVDFSPDVSAVATVRNNEFIQRANLGASEWGLGNFLNHILNGGMFFRSADSKRSGNYFAPPLSGIPRYMKPDPFWETTFQLHDLFHHGIPDQIFTGNSSEGHRNVYIAARLMSEALTIIMADMLFIEEIKKSGFEYDFTTRKISPLFDALYLPEGERAEQLKALLWANVSFALLGDRSAYEEMLQPGQEAALDAYTSTYQHFFIPDMVWSAENYDDMASRSETFGAWVDLVGRDMFARAGLPLLDELTEKLQKQDQTVSYEDTVRPIFDHLFDKVILPKVSTAVEIDEAQATSNAFLRYMIGQCSMYAAYRHVDGMTERGQRMGCELRKKEQFSQDDIERLRGLFLDDVTALQEAGVITQNDFEMFQQIHPIFSPRFLSYDFDQTVYDTIPETIEAVFGEPKMLNIPEGAIIVVASRDKDEIDELRRLLSVHDVHVEDMASLENTIGEIDLYPEETHHYADTARVKVEAVTRAIQDSDIVAGDKARTYVLGGGVHFVLYGTRWQAGNDITRGETQNDKLFGQLFPGGNAWQFLNAFEQEEDALQTLPKIAQTPWCAFEAVLAVKAVLDAPNDKPHCFKGSLEGQLADVPKYGKCGFAFDPMFIPQDEIDKGQHRSLAQMPAVEKDGVSHRAQAFRAFEDAALKPQSTQPENTPETTYEEPSYG